MGSAADADDDDDDPDPDVARPAVNSPTRLRLVRIRAGPSHVPARDRLHERAPRLPPRAPPRGPPPLFRRQEGRAEGRGSQYPGSKAACSVTAAASVEGKIQLFQFSKAANRETRPSVVREIAGTGGECYGSLFRVPKAKGSLGAGLPGQSLTFHAAPLRRWPVRHVRWKTDG